jgi:hypothetical protein
MISPAGELETIVSHLSSERSERFKRKIGPLAGKECDWT